MTKFRSRTEIIERTVESIPFRKREIRLGVSSVVAHLLRVEIINRINVLPTVLVQRRAPTFGFPTVLHSWRRESVLIWRVPGFTAVELPAQQEIFLKLVLLFALFLVFPRLAKLTAASFTQFRR